MGNERRTADRVYVNLPITLDGGQGVTRNVNSTGVYFESDVNCVPGSEVNFSLEFDNPGYPRMTWNCKGLIIRVEQRHGKNGIAARITESSLLTTSKSGCDAAWVRQ